MNISKTNLRSERLNLTLIQLEDAKEVNQNFTQEVVKYLYPKLHRNLQETKEIVAWMIRNNESLQEEVYTIRLKDTDEFIGLCGLHNLKNLVEVGIWTKASSFGNHYGREAVGLLLKRAKSLKIDTVIYPVDYRNIASVKVAQYFGGVLVNHKEKTLSADERVLYIDKYEIKL